MTDYKTASRTKDHFQDQLLTDHPEIVSIAPRLKFDDDGNLTNEAVIVIGVHAKHLLQIGPDVGVAFRSVLIPNKLSIIDDQGRKSRSETVEVIVENEGIISVEMNTQKRRPCPGGFSIGHPRVTAGTLGGPAYLGGVSGYMLSNNHVLAASNSAHIGDSTYQPGVYDGGTSADTIGRLERFVPIDFNGGNNEVDCALSQALNAQDVAGYIQSIGTITGVGDATVNQSVRKSGRTTQLTTGTIVSDNATIFVSYDSSGTAKFVNQLQYTRMTSGGDSGSFVVDSNSLTALGLHFAGSSSASYGNKMQRVLTLLGQARTVYDIVGKAANISKENVSIVS